jgi:hypothetical protein
VKVPKPRLAYQSGDQVVNRPAKPKYAAERAANGATPTCGGGRSDAGGRRLVLQSTGVSLAMPSASHFMPWRLKFTWARASSPAPFDGEEHALAELDVEDALAGTEAVRRDGGRAHRRRRRRGARLDAARADDRAHAGAARPGVAVAAFEARGEGGALRRDPAQRRLRQLVEKAALGVVAGLAMQHARLREAEVEALPGPGDGHVHEPPLLLEAVGVVRRVVVREEALLQSGDEDDVELEALGRVDRHQLHRVLAGLRLVVAGLERGVGEERRQRREHLSGVRVRGPRRCRRRIAPTPGPAPRGVGESIVHDALDHARARRLELGLPGLPQLVDRQRHGILAEALLRHEGLGRIDELLEVLEPLLALSIGLVEVDQARALEDVDDDVAQRLASGRGAHRVDLLHEPDEVRAALAGDGADARRKARAGRPGRVLQELDRAAADAARGEVDDAQEARVVVRVLEQAQVREGVLDLGALEEAQAPVDLVRHAVVEERALHDAALRVAAVEERHLLAGHALAHQLPRLVDEPLRLGVVARRLGDAHRLARPGLGVQVLAETLRVPRDELVGRVEDVAVRAVVALELDHVPDAVLALERRHVADLRAAEGVDALVVVAHGEERAAVLGRPANIFSQAYCRRLVSWNSSTEDVAEAVLVVLAQRPGCRAAARRRAASARRSRPRPRAGTAPRRPRTPARGRGSARPDLDVLRAAGLLPWRRRWPTVSCFGGCRSSSRSSP